MIEAAQYVLGLGRVSAVDDVLLNTLGGAVAAVVGVHLLAPRVRGAAQPGTRRGRLPSLPGPTHPGGVNPDADLLLRRGRLDDVNSLAPMSGSADRALARLRAAGTGDETLLVAEHDGRVVAAVSVRWHHDCDPPHPWLYGLHVSAAVRRHGFGTLLLGAAETVASLRGVEAMSLDVDRGETGLVAFYERRGYAKVGPHEHHWRSVSSATGDVVAEGTADTWIMRHRLGSD
ncbi:GNAT family N-acetyltransferase [Cellulomonas sp. 179-A 4D5 NHS]|uniref:GNAT family N-acetyltransferase n=1 Tax=Cellulomonas sp. 179-A 4D5 NHS TaxID=3142378 RepID=UPI0039A23C05